MEYFAFILLSIVILLLMVLIHESGHYTIAKILGFTVDEFAVGFGPKLLSRRRKNGELFSLRALPLGGFCAFYGETDEEEPQKAEQADVNADASVADQTADTDEQSAPADEPKPDDDLLSYVMHAKIEEDNADAAANAAADVLAEQPAPPRLDKDGNPALTFNAQKPWKRILVLLGGVLFNFLSAIVFSFIYIWAVGYSVPQINDVYKDINGVPYNAELQTGDIIIAVDDEEISLLRSFDEIMEDRGDVEKVTFRVERNGEVVPVTVTRQHIVAYNDDGEIRKDSNGNKIDYTGFGYSRSTEFRGASIKNAIIYSVPYTGKLSWAILGSFGKLITGKEKITNMSGPVGSVKLMADVSSANWRNILILLPLLASNLAIFNLLPFPALDGAHVVFTAVEWVRKKPIKRKVENMIHLVGMGVLLLFVLIVDILSFAL